MADKVTDKCEMQAPEPTKGLGTPTNPTDAAHYNFACQAMNDSRGAAPGLPEVKFSNTAELEHGKRPEPSPGTADAPAAAKGLEAKAEGKSELKDNNKILELPADATIEQLKAARDKIELLISSKEREEEYFKSLGLPANATPEQVTKAEDFRTRERFHLPADATSQQVEDAREAAQRKLLKLPADATREQIDAAFLKEQMQYERSRSMYRADPY